MLADYFWTWLGKHEQEYKGRGRCSLTIPWGVFSGIFTSDVVRRGVMESARIDWVAKTIDIDSFPKAWITLAPPRGAT